jgi:pre-rRNA-processing protein IPI3
MLSRVLSNLLNMHQDQLHLKLHLPERLSALKVSPNGLWAAGGSPSGHIYLWEVGQALPGHSQ